MYLKIDKNRGNPMARFQTLIIFIVSLAAQFNASALTDPTTVVHIPPVAVGMPHNFFLMSGLRMVTALGTAAAVSRAVANYHVIKAIRAHANSNEFKSWTVHELLKPVSACDAPELRRNAADLTKAIETLKNYEKALGGFKFVNRYAALRVQAEVAVTLGKLQEIDRQKKAFYTVW